MKADESRCLYYMVTCSNSRSSSSSSSSCCCCCSFCWCCCCRHWTLSPLLQYWSSTIPASCSADILTEGVDVVHKTVLAWVSSSIGGDVLTLSTAFILFSLHSKSWTCGSLQLQVGGGGAGSTKTQWCCLVVIHTPGVTIRLAGVLTCWARAAFEGVREAESVPTVGDCRIICNCAAGGARVKQGASEDSWLIIVFVLKTVMRWLPRGTKKIIMAQA